MRVPIRSSAIATAAVAGISALAITSAAPAPEVYSRPTTVHEISLAAAPALAPGPAPGELILRALSNQVQNFQLQLPYIAIGVIDAPIALVLSPLTFVGALGSGASLLQSIGYAGGSVTGQVSRAWNGLVFTDAFSIVPRAQNSLAAAVLAAIRIGEAVVIPTGGPGGILQTIQQGRIDLNTALSQPLPPAPTGLPPIPYDPVTTVNPVTLPEVVGVEAVNVFSAIVLQATSVVLLGYIDAPNAFFQTLATTGDPVKALVASGSRFIQGFTYAGHLIGAAVDTAVTNIGDAAHDPFPTVTSTEVNRSTTPVQTNLVDTTNSVQGIDRGGDAKDSQLAKTLDTTPPDPGTPRVSTTTSGPIFKPPSFKAIPGGAGPSGTRTPGGLTGTPFKSAVEQAQSAISNVGDEVKKVADNITKAATGGGAASTGNSPSTG
ncbi:MAG: hypothetical protein JWR37_190 [Mycobacterium sp.]|jgi:hypothetical protein|nr:hypothetical protein [Mycobacterium sp.]